MEGIIIMCISNYVIDCRFIQEATRWSIDAETHEERWEWSSGGGNCRATGYLFLWFSDCIMLIF